MSVTVNLELELDSAHHLREYLVAALAERTVFDEGYTAVHDIAADLEELIEAATGTTVRVMVGHDRRSGAERRSETNTPRSEDLPQRRSWVDRRR